ncbi:tryptophan synthase subunit alpha [Clostridium botulinum]|nr:tryptophan synthase subunit alpha [Clostridium botulinum]NFO92189.1 tryptophan synthase subunit alpha [Clostridium botulinum]
MKESLLATIYAQEEENENLLPIVSLELFFEGNDDIGSIGCNILEHPGTEKFYSILKEIRNKPNVQDVLIEIMEYDEGDDVWPFSERVYILTDAEEDEVMKWVEDLDISEISEGYIYGQSKAAPKLSDGCRVYSLWWD